MASKLLFRATFLVLIYFSPFNVVIGQDDLMALLEEETQDENKVEYDFATFKTTRIINGQSIETPAPGVLQFVIGHRFGKLSDGAYDLFGLDNASIRLGFEYGVTERLALGFGRSSFRKTLDGSLKYKLLRQSHGAKVMPVTVEYYGSIAVDGLKYADQARDNYFSSRLYYNHQLLIARKFNSDFSLQLTPGLVHRNFVQTIEDPNDIYSMGFGGRVKLGGRVTLNGEYFLQLNQNRPNNYDAASIGFDIETGGHVFSLHVTNSQAMIAPYAIPETNGNILDGDIYFGFNVNRVFTLVRR
jgi:hypothetical protein